MIISRNFLRLQISISISICGIVAMSGAIALVACQSAVNLDVKYTDAGSVGDSGPNTQTPPSSAEGTEGAELEGCPCDMSQGLACCVSSVGPPFCTTDKDRCDSENGAFYRCFGPDLGSESVCCWHGSGAGAVTAYAAVCADGGVEACITTKDCSNGQECKTHLCPQNITIGACGQDPPGCPP